MQLTDEPDKRCYPLDSHLLCRSCHISHLNDNPPEIEVQLIKFIIIKYFIKLSLFVLECICYIRIFRLRICDDIHYSTSTI